MRRGAAASTAVALVLTAAMLAGPRTAAAEHLLQGEERSQLLERFAQRQRDVRSFRATVLQRREHPLLKSAVQSEGTLIVQRPDRLRWEVVTPEHLIIVINGSTLFMYRPAKREAERRDLRGDLGSQAALEFLNAGMSLSVPELEKRFQVDVSHEDGELTLRLTPRSRWVAQAVTSITITQADGDLTPREFVVVGRKGDRTDTKLTDVVINPELPDDSFTLRLGPDVRVTDGRQAAGDGESGR